MKRSGFKSRGKPLERRSQLRAASPAKAEVKLPGARKCKVCAEPFRPSRALQTWCSPECGVKLAQKLVAKKAALEVSEHRKKLADSKPLAHWIALTESVVHRYIHARDRGLPCISCGTRRTVQWEAGHWLTKAARPELRFDPRNINLQCHRCNEHLSGNQAAYRIGLVQKIGEEAVQELEGPHHAAKYTREQLAGIRKHFARLTREMEKA
jgi:hypothetical protein